MRRSTRPTRVRTCGHRARVGVHLDGGAELRAVERLELLRDLGEAGGVSGEGSGGWMKKS